MFRISSGLVLLWLRCGFLLFSCVLGGGAGWAAASASLMSSTWDSAAGTLRVFRNGQLVMVYQRDVLPGRSIANAITEIYAVGQADNLVSDHSPLVPPQVYAEVQVGQCSNEPSSNACDFFAHHNPQVEILQSGGAAVRFRVSTSEASQHKDAGLTIQFGTVMIITIPFHPEHTIVQYEVETSLRQPLNVRHALRPLPFFELVRNPYQSIAFSNGNCQVQTVPIPTSGMNQVFIDSLVCNRQPWAAMYHSDKGNLGLVLEKHEWSSGQPKLLSYTEPLAHPGSPNVYFKSSDDNRRYEAGQWKTRMTFLAYLPRDATVVEQFGDRFVTSVSAASYADQPVAADSITAAFSAQLATTTATATDTDPIQPGVQLPTSLAGTQVRVLDSAGTEWLAPLFFVSPTQVNYLIPATTPEGTAAVTVTNGAGTVSWGTINVKRVAPGLFSANSQGTGLAAGRFHRRNKRSGETMEEPLSPTGITFAPDTEDAYLILFGSGFRRGNAPSTFRATVGNVEIPLSFLGPQVEFVGLDQINLGPLPGTLKGRGLMDILLSIEGETANVVQVNLR